MLHFDCDYMRGAHPKVMEALLQTNMTQTVGYGLDEYSVRAKDKIRVACGTPDADVDFFCGWHADKFHRHTCFVAPV